MKRVVLFWLAAAGVLMAANVAINGFRDLSRITAPSNPTSGFLRLFANNATGKLACLDNSGADCMPSSGVTPLVNTYASVSAASCSVGQLGLLTNSAYSGVCTAANVWSWLWHGRLVTPPPTAGWTWTNQGGSTNNSTAGPLFLVISGTPTSWRLYTRNVPGATPWTVYTSSVVDGFTESTSASTDGTGICLADGSGKFTATYMLIQNAAGDYGLAIENWTNITTFSADVLAVTHNTDPRRPWGRLAQNLDMNIAISDDGANLHFYVFPDDTYANKYELISVPRTSFFAAGPTIIGPCMRSSSTQGSTMTLMDYTAQ